MFLHAGWLHVFFNMLFLWTAGVVLERYLGFYSLPLYVICGVAAAVAQMEWGLPPTEVMVGASRGRRFDGFCAVRNAGSADYVILCLRFAFRASWDFRIAFMVLRASLGAPADLYALHAATGNVSQCGLCRARRRIRLWKSGRDSLSAAHQVSVRREPSAKVLHPRRHQ